MIDKLIYCVGTLLMFSYMMVKPPSLMASMEDKGLYYNSPKPIKLKYLMIKEPNGDKLMEALIHYNIKFPEIVYAQAILETGHFKSRVCKKYNNLFGLYNSRTKDYYKFNHWSESVIAYAKYIQYKYREGEDYYNFLSRIGYAEDPLYINKLKVIVKGIN